MSLTVYLNDDDGNEVYCANITHNLNRMAKASGLYHCLWKPDEIEISKAHQLIEWIQAGLIRLVLYKKMFEQYNAPNGWGTWENFVPWVADYLQACRDYPDANVSVSR